MLLYLYRCSKGIIGMQAPWVGKKRLSPQSIMLLLYSKVMDSQVAMW